MTGFFDPRSIAVIGASNDASKWGFWLAAGALTGAGRRRVHLINPNAASVQGHPTVPELAALPEVPELLAVCIPPKAASAAILEALELGVRAFVVITSRLEGHADVIARVRAAGARMVGPNSLGIADTSTELLLAWGNITPGSTAVITQSGQIGTEVATLLSRSGLGVSRLASVGGQSDVRAAELIEELAGHEATSLVVIYLESFSDADALIGAMRRLRAADKPPLVLTTGASDAGQRLAQSHSGAMTSNIDTVDAACRAAGAVRLSTPSEVVELAGFIASAWMPAGRRTAVVSDSGGQAGIAADIADHRGLSVAPFSETTRAALHHVLAHKDTIDNPIDLDGAGEADLSVYSRTVDILLSDDDIDSVIITGYFGSYGEDIPELADRELAEVEAIGRAAGSHRKPVVVHSMSADSAAVAALWENWVPSYSSIDASMRVLSTAARYARQAGRSDEGPLQDSVVLPWGSGYSAARQVITQLGITMPPAVTITRSDGFDAAVAEAGLRPPLVVKAGWPAHKTDVGGIALNLPDLQSAKAAHAEIVSRIGDGEFVIEEMDRRENVVEILIGGRDDENFGPLVVVGAGGTEAELYGDTAIELAPVSRQEALDMLARLKAYRLLTGWRGRPPVDIDAAADAIVAVSRLIAANSSIAEVEINPLRVGVDGALAVDALVIPAAVQEESA